MDAGFYAIVPSFFGLGFEDGHVPTFWLLLPLTLLGGPEEDAAV